MFSILKILYLLFRHKCPHCQEEFSSKVKLSSHVKTHAPEKPFKCIVQVCLHMYRYHSNTRQIGVYTEEKEIN